MTTQPDHPTTGPLGSTPANTPITAASTTTSPTTTTPVTPPLTPTTTVTREDIEHCIDGLIAFARQEVEREAQSGVKSAVTALAERPSLDRLKIFVETDSPLRQAIGKARHDLPPDARDLFDQLYLERIISLSNARKR